MQLSKSSTLATDTGGSPVAAANRKDTPPRAGCQGSFPMDWQNRPVPEGRSLDRPQPNCAPHRMHARSPPRFPQSATLWNTRRRRGRPQRECGSQSSSARGSRRALTAPQARGSVFEQPLMACPLPATGRGPWVQVGPERMRRAGGKREIAGRPKPIPAVVAPTLARLDATFSETLECPRP